MHFLFISWFLLRYRVGTLVRIVILWLRNLRVKVYWFNIFKLVLDKTWQSTNESARNLVIEHFEAKLGLLGLLELLVIFTKLYFLSFSGLNPIGNNLYYSIILLILLFSSHFPILDYGLP